MESLKDETTFLFLGAFYTMYNTLLRFSAVAFSVFFFSLKKSNTYLLYYTHVNGFCLHPSNLATVSCLRSAILPLVEILQ